MKQLATLADVLPPHYSFRVERVAVPIKASRKLNKFREPLAEIGRVRELKPLTHTSKRAAKGKSRVIKPQNWRVYGSF